MGVGLVDVATPPGFFFFFSIETAATSAPLATVRSGSFARRTVLMGIGDPSSSRQRLKSSTKPGTAAVPPAMITSMGLVKVVWVFLKCAPTDRADAERLLEIPGVRRAEVFSGTATLPRFPLRGLELAALTREGGVLEGDPVLATAYEEQRGLIVSRRLAHLRGLEAGGEVALRTDQGGVTYTVLAVTDRVGIKTDLAAT